MSTCSEALTHIDLNQAPPVLNVLNKNPSTLVNGKYFTFDFERLEKLIKNESSKLIESSETEEDQKLIVVLSPQDRPQALFLPIEYESERGSRASNRVNAFNAVLIAKIKGRYLTTEPSVNQTQ